MRLFELESLSFNVGLFSIKSLSSDLNVLASLVALKMVGGEVRVEVRPLPGLKASGRAGGSRRGAWEVLGGRAGGGGWWLRGGGAAMALVSSRKMWSKKSINSFMVGRYEGGFVQTAKVLIGVRMGGLRLVRFPNSLGG